MLIEFPNVSYDAPNHHPHPLQAFEYSCEFLQNLNAILFPYTLCPIDHVARNLFFPSNRHL